jgi:hypothetical protein
VPLWDGHIDQLFDSALLSALHLTELHFMYRNIERTAENYLH